MVIEIGVVLESRFIGQKIQKINTENYKSNRVKGFNKLGYVWLLRIVKE